MSDEEKSKEGNIEGAINAVTGLAKAIPVYEDAVQPAAKEIGKTLETVAKTVNVALAPVKGLIWGYEQLEGFVSKKVSEKLTNTPEADIVTPKPNVAGPALEALRYAGHEDDLSELYANLLAASMDRLTSNSAHPSFVEILKQLTPDEAKILKYFTHQIPFPILRIRREQTGAQRGGTDLYPYFSTLGEQSGCEHPSNTPAYLDNLTRLGLIQIPEIYEYTAPNVYNVLENHPIVLHLKESVEKQKDADIKIIRRGVIVTQLGKQFISICVSDHLAKRPEKP